MNKKGNFSKLRAIRRWNPTKQYVNLKFSKHENAKQKFKKGIVCRFPMQQHSWHLPVQIQQ